MIYEKLPIDEQINQMKISIPCLKTLRSFLRKCKNLQTEHVLKLVGSYLLNYYNAIFAEGEKEKLKSNEIILSFHLLDLWFSFPKITS